MKPEHGNLQGHPKWRTFIMEAMFGLALLVAAEGTLAFFDVLSPPAPFRPDEGGILVKGNPDWCPEWRTQKLYPERAVFPVRKGDEVIRIFCIGDSALGGFPFPPDVAVPARLLEVLDQRLPDIEFEVVNATVGGTSSREAKEIVESALGYEADLIVLYTGGNEFLWPYAVDSVRQLEDPLVWQIKRGLERIRLARLFATMRWDRPPALAGAFKNTGTIVSEPWGGGRLDKQFVVQLFLERIEEILALAGERGVPLVLCTPPANLVRHPFGSVFNASMSEADREAWMESFNRGERLAEAGDLQGALEQYRESETLDPGVAVLQHRMASVCNKLGDFEEARRRFEAALVADDKPQRPPDEVREVIRGFDGRPGVVVADIDRAVASALDGQSPLMIYKFMHDGEHLTPAGSRLAARTITDAMASAGVPCLEWEPYREPTEEEHKEDEAVLKKYLDDDRVSRNRRVVEKRFAESVLALDSVSGRESLDDILTAFDELDERYPSFPHGKVGKALVAAWQGDAQTAQSLFNAAAPPEEAAFLLEKVCSRLENLGKRAVEAGL